MSDDTPIDFAAERERRIHDLYERRLLEVRKAFEQALPLAAKPARRPRKKR